MMPASGTPPRGTITRCVDATFSTDAVRTGRQDRCSPMRFVLDSPTCPRPLRAPTLPSVLFAQKLVPSVIPGIVFGALALIGFFCLLAWVRASAEGWRCGPSERRTEATSPAARPSLLRLLPAPPCPSSRSVAPRPSAALARPASFARPVRRARARARRRPFGAGWVGRGTPPCKRVLRDGLLAAEQLARLRDCRPTCAASAALASPRFRAPHALTEASGDFPGFRALRCRPCASFAAAVTRFERVSRDRTIRAALANVSTRIDAGATRGATKSLSRCRSKPWTPSKLTSPPPSSPSFSSSRGRLRAAPLGDGSSSFYPPLSYLAPSLLLLCCADHRPAGPPSSLPSRR